ncbi:hypothetical protein MLP_06820 [Microlunatus phosphovorus NM-1]|uniref:DUF4143 domain-containing protein n=1 Tax=Microlunatus phosphovorus (strain ATCC 700054 / DSM 10555 / JCM 9379 / NBRC 101784 / NCIMB 13414 / VKM Ac-1990 / NM-1) TaxID=1032480 RepID=F5XL08_MICPN|nr:DUF4143 domain-containing protein [Microlunatus phosphovorus]BAK33696.1 hypothetical protein MLP_06820 [Microlunatus phosphovorus NM-1]
MGHVYSRILDAATPGEDDKPSRQTVASYREHLIRIFVLDPVPAWIPAFSPLKRLTHSPKHHLVDPGLAARLAGVSIDGLLRGEGDRVTARPDTNTWLGALFEYSPSKSSSVARSATRMYVTSTGCATSSVNGWSNESSSMPGSTPTAAQTVSPSYRSRCWVHSKSVEYAGAGQAIH